MLDFLGLMVINAGANGLGLNWGGSGQNLAYRKKDFNAISGTNSINAKLIGPE